MTITEYKGFTAEPKKLKHEEAELHLKFCKWVKKNYPKDSFVRHEKEKARSKYLQNLMKVYNNIGGLCDFELIMACGAYNGLYIEFKKPGEKWLLKDNQTVKPAYTHQYEFHLNAWKNERCAYFCNDFDSAVEIYIAYKSGQPLQQQKYLIQSSTSELNADQFFNDRGL